MFWNESAGQAALAGVQTRLVPNDSQGRMNPDDVAGAIRPPGNLHFLVPAWSASKTPTIAAAVGC